MKVFAGSMVLLICGLVSATAQSSSSTAAAQAPARQTVAAATGGQSKTDAAKEADIRRLLELLGTNKLMSQVMDSSIGNIKPVLTNALPPGDYREKLVELFFAKFKAKADIRQLIDMAVAAYDKHFSADEIKSLIKFYETPVGQKAASVLPQLVQEMGDAGRSWGERLGRECMQEVLAEYPEMKEALEAAGKAAQQQ